MRALFEQVSAHKLSLTAGVLVAALLTACGGGITDGAATASADQPTASDGTTNQQSTTTPVAAADVPTPTLGSIALSWSAPSTNADGSPVSDLAGYRVYYGTAQGFYTDNVTINNPATLSTTISNLPADTYYVVVRAFNSVNAESQASIEVSKTIK